MPSPGATLRAIRETQGITQQAVADQIEKTIPKSEVARARGERVPRWDRVDVWKMEEGQRSIDGPVLKAWLNALGVDSRERWSAIAGVLGVSFEGFVEMLGLPIGAFPDPDEEAA